MKWSNFRPPAGFKQSGSEWCGPCDRHPDSKDTFCVNPTKETWICHRCGSDADVEHHARRLGIWEEASPPRRRGWSRNLPWPSLAKKHPDWPADTPFETVEWRHAADGSTEPQRVYRHDGAKWAVFRVGSTTRDLIFLTDGPGDQAIILVEGAKCARHAREKTGRQALAFVGASAKPTAAMLAVAKGRKVLCWPDNDDAGERLMERAAAAAWSAGATDVRRVNPASLGLTGKGHAADDWNGGGGFGAVRAASAPTDRPDTPLLDNPQIDGISRTGLEQALGRLGVAVRWNNRGARVEVENVDHPGVWTALNDRREDRLREVIRDRFVVPGAKGEGRPAVFGSERWRVCLNALLADHEADPVAAWLDGLPAWDGTVRLDTILSDLWGCTGDLAAWASQYLVLAPVQRTRAPGGPLREIPVLIGGQGSGKSELVRSLCPALEWFGDGLDFSERTERRIEACLGKLVVEASEMAGAGRTEIESIKAFITRRDDYMRLAYARHPESRPRRFAIVGTANDTGNGVLPNDPSGNTRFVPIELQAKRSLVGDVRTWADERRDQWFAEALVRHGQGLRANLPYDLMGEQAEATEAHRRADVGLEDRVADLPLGAEVRVQDVVSLLNETKDWGEKNARRLGAVLRAMGYVLKRRWRDGKVHRVWVRDANDGGESST